MPEIFISPIKLSNPLTPPEGFSKEQETVFDPLYKTVLKRIVRTMGWDDPNNIVQGFMSPMAPAVGPLIAAVKPHEIPALRQRGKELLERVLKNGLERRTLGQRPVAREFVDKAIELENAGIEVPEHMFKPNIPVPGELAQALTYAQQKYPRIFGHLTDITSVEDLVKLKGKTLGAMWPNTTFDPDIDTRFLGQKFVPQKTATLQLDPEVIAKSKKWNEGNAVGHEMLHLADNIVDPKKLKEGNLRSMELPGGYDANAYERRADVQGYRFDNAMKGIPNPKPLSLSAIEDQILANQPKPKPYEGVIQRIIDMFDTTK